MRPLALLLGLVLLIGALFAQEATEDQNIQVDVNVVNIPVTVTDQEGRFIVALKKEDFEIREDGQPVEIRYFTPSVDQEAKPPIRAGFLIDLSNTARLYYKNYKESIGDLAYLLVPEGGDSEGFLIGYHTEVDVLVDHTRDPYKIATRMEKLKHGGGAAMLDAAYLACTEKLLSSPYKGVEEPRKIVVIVGDGHDNASKRSLDEVIHAAQKHQVTIYGVSTVAWGFHEEQEKNLYELARATGGLVAAPMQDVHKDVSGYLSKPQDAGNYQYQVGTGLYARAQLEALYRAILDVAGNVQSQYILGYSPPTPFTDGKYRQVDIRVKLDAPLEVHHRTGYFPPDVQ